MPTVNTEAIPDELKERDQWLLWDASADTPRRPHWAGNFGVSWSDPDSWHSFGEAIAAAESRESWGIGYVTAAENPDFARGLYGVLDLDGAATDDQHAKDWVPSLAPFFDRDAYVEWSPSGTGLHIPVVGIDVPDWWRDTHRGDHEGVDVLTHKFCTFTGDREEPAGDAVVEYGGWVDAWLADAYEALTDETAPPREGGAEGSADVGGGDRDDWLTADVVRDALGEINPDVNYPTWRNIGFGLADEFDDGTAERLFTEWSRGGSKWDREAEDRAARIIRDANPAGNGGVSIGTVIYHAKKAGWSPPDDASTNAASASSDDNAEPKTNGDGPTADTDGWSEVYRGYAEASEADERKMPRYQATEQLDQETAWRCIIKNDSLWRYDPEAGIYRDDGDGRIRERLVDKLREEFKAHEQKEISEQIRGRYTIREQQMGGPANHVATENCVLEITRDGIEMHDHSPEYEFIGRVQTEYDPEADCPRFRSFLKESVDQNAERQTLQEYAGYCLMHWKLPHHKALFLVGPTASGKSTFLDTIRAMLGQDATASLTPQQMTSERFGGAELYGAWANIRNDIPASVIEDTGQFKEIVAGDPIKAEEKYQDPFMFEPTAKHMFSANQLPQADTDDEAFFRRILLIAFPSTVPRGERDPQLDAKLEAELPGVLNWALDGLRRLMQQGRFSRDRTPGQTQETWDKWGNSVSRFEKVCLEESTDGHLAKSDIYSAYVAFCEDEGIPTETQHMLTRELKLQGYEDGRQVIDGEQERAFHNVAFTSRGAEYRDGANDDQRGAGGDRNDDLGGF